MRRPRPKTPSQLEAECIVWNHKYPVGTQVRFHPIIGASAYRERRTTGLAFILSGHTACVALESESGCVALDACEVVES